MQPGGPGQQMQPGGPGQQMQPGQSPMLQPGRSGLTGPMPSAQMMGQMSMTPGQGLMPGFQGAPYPPMPHNPYGPPAGYHGQGAPMSALEQAAHLEGRKKTSSIARDVAIGVAIAALVLGGFLAVKFLLLDGDSATTESGSSGSPYAKVKTMLAGGEAANLFLDDKLHATMRNNQEVDVQPGHRRVKLVGPSGVCFDQELTLVAGKVTTASCTQPAAGAGSGSAAPAAPAAPAAAAAPGGDAAGSGSAASAATPPGTPPAAAPGTTTGTTTAPAPGSTAGSANGSGSAAPAATPDHPAPDKTDRMPTEETKPADHSADRPHHATERPAARPTEHPKPAVDDDLGLGKLQGGVKPGKAADPKKH
jgi:hypothetical protein